MSKVRYVLGKISKELLLGTELQHHRFEQVLDRLEWALTCLFSTEFQFCSRTDHEVGFYSYPGFSYGFYIVVIVSSACSFEYN